MYLPAVAEPLRVYVTVDVECSEERRVTGRFRRPSWRPALGYDLRVWGRFDNQKAPLGIELIMRELEAGGARGTFFLEALGAHHFGRERLREVCAALATHDVQLHTHPIQRRADYHSRGEEPAPDDIAAYPVEQQTELIREGVDLLAEAGVPRAKLLAFRAGNFGASNETWEALSRAGLRLSSNYNPCYFSRNCRMRSDRARAGLFESEIPGVYELPISTFAERGGSFRHLQITAVSLRETIDALRQYRALGVTEVTIVTHSFEFFFMDSYAEKRARPNDVNIERLRGLVRFVGENPRDFRFDTVGALAERLPLAVGHQRRMPHGRSLLRAGRLAEQGYKRLVQAVRA